MTLSQNYPNPSGISSITGSTKTNIQFTLSEESPITLVVYNSLGIEVARLVDEILLAGVYLRSFDASKFPAGTYIYRLGSGSFNQMKLMTLIK